MDDYVLNTGEFCSFCQAPTEKLTDRLQRPILSSPTPSLILKLTRLTLAFGHPLLHRILECEDKVLMPKSMPDLRSLSGLHRLSFLPLLRMPQGEAVEEEWEEEVGNLELSRNFLQRF